MKIVQNEMYWKYNKRTYWQGAIFSLLGKSFNA